MIEVVHQALQFAPVNTQPREQLVVIEHAFEEQEMNLIEKNLSGIELEVARVGSASGDGDFDFSTRDSRIAWIAHTPQTSRDSAWLYMSLMERIQTANLRMGLDIWGFAEHLQYSEYGEGGRYGWHMDYGANEKPRPPRKLSFTLQISHAEDYEGGDLEFLLTEKFPASRKRGAMIVFPSYLPHQVTTVTRGLRKSLVGWVCGPDLR